MLQSQIFTNEEIESYRKNGKILRGCLEYAASLVEPGVTTAFLDKKAETFIRSHDGAVPAFKGYRGYPATLCTSVNEQCVHGMPGKYKLKEGDIISVDCGVLYKGHYTDACITVPVGVISEDAQSLLDITELALKNALAALKAGAHVGDLSHAVESTIRPKGFAPIRILTGHGVGATLHQFPDIPNWGESGSGPEFPANTIIAVEPIISMGSDEVNEAKDGWTLSTKDGALAAHFEHTVLVTEKGHEILA